MRLRFFSILLFSSLSISLSATSIFDKLSEAAGEAPLALSLTVALDSLEGATLGKQPAVIEFTDPVGKLQQWDLKVAVRGKFRRHRCAQVPLKLDFRKRDLRAAGLTDFDEYKLVVPCTHHRAAETRIMKEFLAYRAYNVLTPVSFRVQLLKLTLKDVDQQEEDRTITAFLIENTAELADRNSSQHLKNGIGQPASAFLPNAEATHALFQYLIGNTDWNSSLTMNTKSLRRNDGQLIPVGYDFDFSSWVDAPYALPRRQLGQDYLSQRVYLGYVQPNEVLEEVANHFVERREALLTLIDSSLLPSSQRRPLTRIIKSFYNNLEHLQEHDMAMLYGQLRGQQATFIPIGAMPEDFEVME